MEAQRAEGKEGRGGFAECGLVSLVLAIVQEGNRGALREFLTCRHPFQWGQDWLTLPGYLDLIRRDFSATRPNGVFPETADCAYDFTLDKFANLPSESHAAASQDAVQPMKRTGSDCRYYYRAYLRRLEKDMPEGLSEPDQEMFAARTLQRFVKRHFLLSFAEARRHANPYVHRYAWHVDGRVFDLYMPKCMMGNEKRAWLKEHAISLTHQPDARKRIQALVDKQLNNRLPHEMAEHFRRVTQKPPLPWSVEYEVSTKGLAQALAYEKVERINAQRSTIRALGPTRLRALILEIFEGLRVHAYNQAQIAARYGLKQATLSRFAGSTWQDIPSERVPDLWANMAEMLAGHEAFIDAARSAGVWECVSAMANPGAHEPDEEASHE